MIYTLYFLGTQGHPYQYASAPSQYGTMSSVQPSSTPSRLDYYHWLYLLKTNFIAVKYTINKCQDSYILMKYLYKDSICLHMDTQIHFSNLMKIQQYKDKLTLLHR